MKKRELPPIDIRTPQGRSAIRREDNQPEGWYRVALYTALRLLDELDSPHIIDIRDNGWSIRHSLVCRVDMPNCPYNHAVIDAKWESPPKHNGSFWLTLDENGKPVIGTHV